MANAEERTEVLRVLLESPTTSPRAKNDALLQLIEESKTTVLSSPGPLLRTLRTLLVDKEQQVRSLAFRVLRYVCKTKAILQQIFSLCIDLFVARALERDSKFLWERMQALKLVKQMIVVDPSQLSRTIVNSLVSVAEQPKDDFRRISLDAIRELVLVNPQIVSSCNGIRTIVDSILDQTCQDIASSLTLTLLFLLDQDSTRRVLRPSVDLLKLLSVFTETSTPNSPEKEARCAAAHRALVTIMRSWTGILCLTSDPNGLRSLIQLLGLPAAVKGASWAKEAIFDLLFEIMHVVKSSDLHIGPNIWKLMGPNLLHSYIVIVLVAFMDCGLIEILTKLGMSGDKEFSGVATNLLTEILRLSSDLLPRAICAKINALPSVVAEAASFGRDIHTRVRALNMLSGLGTHERENFDENKDFMSSNGRGEVTRQDSVVGGGTASSPRLKVSTRDTRILHGICVEKIALKTDITMDSVGLTLSQDPIPSKKLALGSGGSFPGFWRESGGIDNELEMHASLKKTNVLNTKDYKQWDWQSCLVLLCGSLTNPINLQTALKTKFIKRLLSFLNPEKMFFSDLPWTVANTMYVRVGCQLLRVLLATPDGREFSFFNDLLGKIFAALLAEIEKTNTRKSITDPVKDAAKKKAKASARTFARTHCNTKLSREYFTFLGILSAWPYGQSYFEKFNLYEILNSLWKDPNRDYIARLFVNNLVLTGESSKPRKLLEVWLRNGTSQLRCFIISQLRLLLREDVSYSTWIIDLMVSQLSNTDREVALAALSLLEEACQDSASLELLIKHSPSMKVVGAAGHNLQITFLSSKVGVEYLNSIKWIEPQLRYWRSEGGGNQLYVETLENALVTALSAGTNQNSGRMEAACLAVSQESFAPSGYPGQPARCSFAALRTEEDDYFFQRVHRLPWTVEVVIVSPVGRQLSVIAEAFVNTSYAHEEEGAGLATHVIGVLLDFDGKPKPCRFDPLVTIRARLSIAGGQVFAEGGFQDEKETEKVCTPEDRKGLSPEKSVLLLDQTRWVFQYSIGPGGAPIEELKAVCFRLQLNSTTAGEGLVSLAPHFYGELAKTQEGCATLRGSGHFREFVETIKAPLSSSLQKRACLWALGQIGSSSYGFSLLQETDVVEYISQQAKTCRTLSMRGTCFYILGLLSRSDRARTHLSKLGWQFSPHPEAGIVLPLDPQSFLEIPQTPYVGSWATDPSNKYGVKRVPSKPKPSDKDEKKKEVLGLVVLGHISNLSNHVTQKSSLQSLRTLMRENKALFMSPTLLFETFKLLAAYTFRLPARRFILFDLFGQVQFDHETMEVFDGDFKESASSELIAKKLEAEYPHLQELAAKIKPVKYSDASDDFTDDMA